MAKLDDLSKTYILAQYCKQAAMAMRHKFSSGIDFAVECPFCGTKELKGTIFKTNTNRLCYICWRASCQCAEKAIVATKWLEKVDPQLYAIYKADIAEKEKTDDFVIDKFKKKIEDENEKLLIKQQEEMRIKRIKDKNATKKFVKIDDGSELSKLAIDYCTKRCIPEEIWSKFYIAHEGKYHDRLIIPFYNKHNKIEYFQARTLIGLEPKYMNMLADTQLYNRDFIDPNKPVLVTEGPIDSMFLDNAVATCGAGSSAKINHILNKFKQVFYIFDNDAAGNKEAGKLVRQHKNVFLWTKYLNDLGIPLDSVKDINDVILKINKDKLTYTDLRNYFTNITDEFMCYI